jgi:hypothetical protein
MAAASLRVVYTPSPDDEKKMKRIYDENVFLIKTYRHSFFFNLENFFFIF